MWILIAYRLELDFSAGRRTSGANAAPRVKGDTGSEKSGVQKWSTAPWYRYVCHGSALTRFVSGCWTGTPWQMSRRGMGWFSSLTIENYPTNFHKPNSVWLLSKWSTLPEKKESRKLALGSRGRGNKNILQSRNVKHACHTCWNEILRSRQLTANLAIIWWLLFW